RIFFFQAEDGIRDFHVTGVQTCALPIWPQSSGAGSGGDGPAAEFAGAGAMTEVDAAGAGSSADPGAAGGDDGAVDDDEPGDGVQIGRASGRESEKIEVGGDGALGSVVGT